MVDLLQAQVKQKLEMMGSKLMAISIKFILRMQRLKLAPIPHQTTLSNLTWPMAPRQMMATPNLTMTTTTKIEITTRMAEAIFHPLTSTKNNFKLT